MSSASSPSATAPASKLPPPIFSGLSSNKRSVLVIVNGTTVEGSEVLATGAGVIHSPFIVGGGVRGGDSVRAGGGGYSCLCMQ